MKTQTIINNNWEQTGTLLKLISHPQRLQVLSFLLDSECDLQELSRLTNIPATILSVHLNKLRSHGIVDCTRFHRIMQYRITSSEAIKLLQTVYGLNMASLRMN